MDSKIEKLTPENIREAAETISLDLLPEKSKKQYIICYNKFMKWRESNKATSFSENTILGYFNEISKTMKPSTLWGIYSMLKLTLQMNHDVHLKNYKTLIAFLKRQSTGLRSKKSKVLSSNDVEKFLNEAPDDMYLATKVIMFYFYQTDVILISNLLCLS